MNLQPRIHCPTRKDWRKWLQENHATATEVWLHYHRKHSGKPSVTYLESVEEALCFGWIDGIKRRVDEDRYAHRFTPRRPNSRWSPRNIELAERLIESGQMTGAGLAAFRSRVEYDPAFLAQKEQATPSLPEGFEAALERNSRAARNFEAMAPGYRRQYLAWIGDAKREATRERRIAKAVDMLEQNLKPGMNPNRQQT